MFGITAGVCIQIQSQFILSRNGDWITVPNVNDEGTRFEEASEDESEKFRKNSRRLRERPHRCRARESLRYKRATLCEPGIFLERDFNAEK